MSDERIRKLVAEELAIKGENDFVREVYANDVRDPLDILNWYRNFYCKEGLDTERGLMVNAINDLFMQMNARTERIVERLEQAESYSCSPQFSKAISRAIEIVKGGGVDE